MLLFSSSRYVIFRLFSASTCVLFVNQHCVCLVCVLPDVFASSFLLPTCVIPPSVSECLPVSPLGMFFVLWFSDRFIASCFPWFELCFWFYFVFLVYAVLHFWIRCFSFSSVHSLFPYPAYHPCVSAFESSPFLKLEQLVFGYAPVQSQPCHVRLYRSR